MTSRCLLVIDLVNDFLDPWDAEDAKQIIDAANLLAREFRVRNYPVIWVRQEFKADLSDAFLEMRDRNVHICIEGTRGAQLHERLKVDADDHVIVKKRYSAFYNTELDAVLNRYETEEVTICGINSHACVRMAAIDAYQRDLRVVLASDGIASYNKEHARISLDYMNGKIARLSTCAEILDDISAS